MTIISNYIRIAYALLQDITTDMKSSDPSCILSTLTFISKQAEQIGQAAVVTFDQPLYWKAMEIQIWEKHEPPLK